MKTKQKILIFLLSLTAYSTSLQKVLSNYPSIDQILPYFEGVYSGINIFPTEKDDSGEFKTYITDSNIDFLKPSSTGLNSFSFSKRHYPYFRSLHTEEWISAWTNIMNDQNITDYFDMRAFEYPYLHPQTNQSFFIFFMIPKEPYQHLEKAISVLHINGEFHTTDKESNLYYKPKMYLAFEEKPFENGLSQRIINNLNMFGKIIDRPNLFDEYSPHERVSSSDRVMIEGFSPQYLVPEDCSFYLLN